MSHPPRRRALSGALALLVVPILVVASASSISSAAMAGSSTTGSATAHSGAGGPEHTAVAPGANVAHPFSNPIWYPLREPAVVACVHGNPGCQSPLYHPDWAMDLDSLASDADANPPVYAAGAGILHIGSNSAACSKPGQATSGRWVWIDHGGGVVSKYLHLNTITATDGEYVTPHTQIGTVGNTGAMCGLQLNYLDLIVFHYGLSGTQVEVTSLRGCNDGREQLWPSGLSRYRVWNSVPYKGLTVPQSSSSCLPKAMPETAAAPSHLALSRSGSGKLTASWPAAASSSHVSRAMLEIDILHPSNGQYGTRIYQPVTSGTSAVISGLTNGRTYRVRVSYYNAAGWSAPTSWRTGIPAALPQAPGVRSVTPTRSSVHYLWRKSDSHGATVRYYEIAIHRQLGAGRFTPWIYRRVSANTYHYDFTGLRRHARYAVEVCLVSSVGHSKWSRRYTTTLR